MGLEEALKKVEAESDNSWIDNLCQPIVNGATDKVVNITYQNACERIAKAIKDGATHFETSVAPEYMKILNGYDFCKQHHGFSNNYREFNDKAQAAWNRLGLETQYDDQYGYIVIYRLYTVSVRKEDNGDVEIHTYKPHKHLRPYVEKLNELARKDNLTLKYEVTGHWLYHSRNYLASSSGYVRNVQKCGDHTVSYGDIFKQHEFVNIHAKKPYWKNIFQYRTPDQLNVGLSINLIYEK